MTERVRQRGRNDEDYKNSASSSLKQDDAQITHADMDEDQSGELMESDAPGQEEPETLTNPSTLKDTVTFLLVSVSLV